MDDRDVVAAQIGRPPRSTVDVVVRCPLGLPVVTTVPPLLDDGTPFPTRYWLTCPLAVKRIGRVEGSGGVGAAERLVESDPALESRFARAADRYRRERDALLPDAYEGPRPSGGVGGTTRGVKCLHAHFADFAAGNDNPVGEWVASSVEPLNCTVPCVAELSGEVGRNPEWVEPR